MFHVTKNTVAEITSAIISRIIHYPWRIDIFSFFTVSTTTLRACSSVSYDGHVFTEREEQGKKRHLTFPWRDLLRVREQAI